MCILSRDFGFYIWHAAYFDAGLIYCSYLSGFIVTAATVFSATTVSAGLHCFLSMDQLLFNYYHIITYLYIVYTSNCIYVLLLYWHYSQC